MDRSTLVYWIATGLFCAMFTFSGLAHLVRAEPIAEAMTHLGYPAYVMTILGVAKLLGVIALLAPGQPLLKEWAYAGFSFDLVGATVSHAAVGDPIPQIVTPWVLFAVGAVSYRMRPASRRLQRPASSAPA